MGGGSFSHPFSSSSNHKANLAVKLVSRRYMKKKTYIHLRLNKLSMIKRVIIERLRYC